MLSVLVTSPTSLRQPELFWAIFLNKSALNSRKRFSLDILSDSLHHGLPRSRGTAADALCQQSGSIWEPVYRVNVQREKHTEGHYYKGNKICLKSNQKGASVFIAFGVSQGYGQSVLSSGGHDSSFRSFWQRNLVSWGCKNEIWLLEVSFQWEVSLPRRPCSTMTFHLIKSTIIRVNLSLIQS